MIEGGNLKRPNFIISIVALILVLSVGGCSSGLSDAKLAYNYGTNSSKQGLYAEAIQNFDKAIQLDAEYAKAYNNRGNSYANLGQYQRAIEDFDKAIQLDPNDALTYDNRGLAYDALGQDAEANADQAKACSLNSKQRIVLTTSPQEPGHVRP